MKKQQIPLKNSLILLLTATIWGIAFVAQSEGGEAVGPLTFNATRNIIGSLVLIPVILLLNKINPQSNSADFTESDRQPMASSGSNPFSRNKTLIAGGIICGICLCLASNFQQFGIQYTSVGKAGFLTACYIIIVPILGLFMKKKCSPFIWVAVVMALIGLYLLCITDGFSIGKGDFLVLICAFLFSLHILVIDYFSPKTDGVKMSCIQFLVCGILTAIPAIILEHPSLSSFSGAWGATLYAGVMSCGVAYTLQIVGQKNMNPTVASLILSLESCISVLAGWIIMKKKCSPFIWVAVVMALIGLYLLCITDGFSIGKGDFLVLICAFLFSLHILVIDYFSPKTDGVKMSCIQFLVCGILTAIPAIILEHPSLSSFSGAWGATLYAGVMSCGVAYTLQIVGQKNMNPTVASLILSLESCISVLAGWIILGQKLSTREIIGCVVMFGAIVLAQLPQKETASEK